MSRGNLIMYGVFNVGEIYGVYGVLVIHQGVVIDVILDIKGGGY